MSHRPHIDAIRVIFSPTTFQKDLNSKMSWGDDAYGREELFGQILHDAFEKIIEGSAFYIRQKFHFIPFFRCFAVLIRIKCLMN